ncbi:MAG TPA: sigma-70 family RNA polymerase sigma factor [Acidobacteriota bacterium]|nr:sigma-70 family RNA polymerase sigma factor [Acidobacteriota bacterium]
MNAAKEPDLTRLLQEWSAGNQQAFDQLIQAVYTELRAIAHRVLYSSNSDQTLTPTALVHEAFFKLIDCQNISWHDRIHFFATAARIMRHVLIDYVRQGQTGKRGGDWFQVSLSEANAIPINALPSILDLDTTLTELEQLDQRAARIFELRFFGGLTFDEITQLLGISLSTTKRDWKAAQAFLQRKFKHLAEEKPSG